LQTIRSLRGRAAGVELRFDAAAQVLAGDAQPVAGAALDLDDGDVAAALAVEARVGRGSAPIARTGGRRRSRRTRIS
jgi:hypothetical protein